MQDAPPRGAETSPAPFIPRERATWEQLRSKTTQRGLKDLQRKLAVLSRDLGDYPQSKFALTNLFSGIDSVLNDLERHMSAAEAIEYLEELDLTVTRTLVKEGAPRAEMIRWSEISLAAVLGTRRADRLKQGSVPRFDPRLTLQQVQVFKPGDSGGRFVPGGSVRVSFEAALVGEEISKVELFRNGFLIRTILPRRDPRVKGLLRAQSEMCDAPGVFEVRVSDKYGNVSSRYYDFMRRAAQFGWRYQEDRNLYWAVFAPRIERTAGGLDWYFGFQPPRREPQGDESFFASGEARARIGWWS
jgi:hypothetical protein